MEGANIYKCNSEFTCDREDSEGIIPYATQIEYYTKEIKTNTINTYYEAKYQDKTIFVKVEDLGSEKKVYYFKVSTFSGLHLRESPSIKSKILVTLPYQTVGKIIEADKTIYTIQDRKGYWIQTSYENKIGWLFSGFVFISTDKGKFFEEELDSEQSFFKFFNDIKEWIPEKSKYNSFGENEIEVSSSLKGFHFIYRDNKGKDACYDTRNLFLVQGDKNYYDLTIGVGSGIEKEYGKIFFMGYEGCNCCCSYGETLIVFVLKQRLYSYSINSGSAMGGYLEDKRCFTKVQNIKYLEKNSTAYLYTMYGNCEIKYTEMDRMEVFKDYTHDMFIKIKINEDNLDIKRILDKGIPSEYKQEWEEAEEIWKKKE
jgi:hypothetical protein